MKAIRFLLVFALVSISAGLLFTGAGYAAPFDCEGDTIPGGFVNVDLDTGTCHGGGATVSDEISIYNDSDGSLGWVEFYLFNEASATATGADSGDKTISSGGFTTFYCSSSCTISITGTYKAKPFSLKLEWKKNSMNIRLFDSSFLAAPARVAASSGDGQAADVNTSFANPLVAMVTDSDGNALSGVDVTFAAPSSGASLTFASTGTNTETVATGADGKATSSTMTANAMASSFSGGSLTAYSVSASVTGLTSASFSLTNGRESTADIAKTGDVITTFMTSRAGRVVAAQPNIVSRLRSPFGRQSQANRFSLNAGPGSQSVNLEASLLAFVNKINAPRTDTLAAAPSSDPFAVFDMLDKDKTGTAPGLAYAAQAPEAGGDTPALQEDTPQSGFDAWVQASFAATQNGTSDQRAGTFFAGVDYRFDDTVLVGLLGELDVSDETNTTAKADGIGWMVGPYAVMRLSENLYLDGQASYGRSDNHINALGLFTDQFQTERLLLQAGLTGDFRIEDFTFNPFVRATYYREQQKSYVDSLGNTIPEQTFDLGRLEFGPEVTWAVPTSGEIDLGLSLGLSGIYDFSQLSNGTAPGLASSGTPFRARIKSGVDIGVPDTSFRIAAEGFYDGIGVSDFQSYGGSLNVGASF